MKISEATIEAARCVDPVSIIGHYVKLRRSGKEYQGLCPFHTERTPSFYVHPAKGYKCFGCDESGGSAIDFVMKYEGKTFPDAVQQVCGLAGIWVEHSGSYSPPPARITPKAPPLPPALPIDTIPPEAILKNAEAYKANHLHTFFTSLFGEVITGSLFTRFGVGSANYFGKGTTLFYQVDGAGHVRQLKAIFYDATTGKRNKEAGREPKIIGRGVLATYTGRQAESINLVQCFFNERELSERPEAPAALVESEKSAMIAAVYYPGFVWLATGGKNGCRWNSPDVCRVLKERPVYLFPDVDGAAEWIEKAPDLKQQTGSPVNVITMQEVAGAGGIPPGAEKFDIADFLLLNRDSSGLALTSENYPVIWDYSTPDEYQA